MFLTCRLLSHLGYNHPIMKFKLIIAGVLIVAGISACDVQSGITKKAVEKYEPTPKPSVSPTLEHPPINPSDVVQVDTSQQGEMISFNKPKETRAVTCDKYNQVMVNNSDNVITIKGACSQIMVNGDRNDITTEATMSVVFNGVENKVKYSKYGNGKRPNITDNKAGNTTEKTAVAPTKN